MVAVGKNEDGQCSVDSWKNITAVSAGIFHTVGLKADGTAVAVGNNESGQCNVDSWTDIIAVSAGYDYFFYMGAGDYSIGLKADGAVVIAEPDDIAAWRLW